MIRLVLRAIAATDVAAGIFLGLTTWDRLYHEFGLSAPDQAVFAQTAGAFMIAMGYLLWIAPKSETLTRAVAAGSALAHGLVAALCFVWLIVDRTTLGTHQATALAAVGLTCALAATLGGLLARHNAVPLPRA